MINNKTKLYGYILASLGLAACGGGDSGGNAVTNASPDSVGNAVTNASPGGIWQGTATATGTGTTYQSIGFVTETGELRFLTEDGEQTTGVLTVNGNNYSANLTSYAPLGSIFSQNGLSVISGTASGTINERSTFSGSANISGTVTSTFSFTYDSIYDRDSSLAAVAGIYSDSDGLGYTETYAIDSQGLITGSDTDGCQFNGNIQPLNSNYNMYRINLTITNCGAANDDYTGLAALLDEGGTQNDTLGASLSGSNYVFSGTVPRI